MRGWNMMTLWLAVSVALGGLARAAPDPSPPGEPSPGEQAYALGLLAALEDSDDEVVAWALRLLVQQEYFLVEGKSEASLADVVPGARERLLDFLQSQRATQASRAGDGSLRKVVLITQGSLGVDSPDTARGLVDLLRVEENSGIRDQAETALEKMGEAAWEQAPRLVEMLREQNIDARQSAIHVLRAMGEAARQQVPRLGEMLEDPDWHVRQAAAWALGALGEAASAQVPRLGERLEDPEPQVRQAVARALGDLGEAASTQAPRLGERLEDPEPEVRMAVAQALGALGEAASAQVPRLRKLLKDPDPYVRRVAESALKNLRESSGDTPEATASGLGASWRKAAGALEGRLERLKREHPEDFESMKKARGQREESLLRAMLALAELRLKAPDPGAHRKALELLAYESRYVSGDARVKRLAPLVAELLEDPDPEIRKLAVETLGRLGVRDYAPHVARLLENPDKSLHESAARVLGMLGGREYASRLFAHLEEVRVEYGSGHSEAAWRALIELSPLDYKDVALLVAQKGGNPASRPLWLARAHGLGGGEPQAERVLRRLGMRAQSQLPSVTYEEARTLLEDFSGLWPQVEKSPALENELAQQIARVAMDGHGKWREADRAGLERHEQNLRNYPSMQKDVRTAIDSIPRQSVWPRTVAWSWGAHAGFWLLLLFFYPRSAKVQALFFWNPWVRRLLGLGYVGVLLTWVPFLRRRLLGPFRPLLLADADLGRFSPEGYFQRSEVLVAATGQRVPLLEALPRLRGQVVLEGASGLGKSMFIRHQLCGSKALSVYLPAGRCKEGVIEAIQGKLEGHARDTGFLQSIIYSGALDIYIDGLNEVGADTRARVVQFVEPKFHGNILLATQRMEWTPPATASLYELQPLTEAQVSEFLLGREPLLGERARLRGEAYREACGHFLSLALSLGQPEELRQSMLEVLSNPMDLTVVAQMLAAGHAPDLFRLQQQQYALMARDYHEVNLEAFPLESFSEEAYRMRREDRGAISEERFGKELLRMEAFKMVVRREWSGAEGMAGREWHFRHDKLQDFFIAQTFLGPGNARIVEHVDDPRFRGVYFLLARLLEPERARELQDHLVERAAETHDHTVSDEFVTLLRARHRAARAGASLPSHGDNPEGP